MYIDLHIEEDIYSTHMFPQTGMHTHAPKNTDMRGGAFWPPDQGQQGIFDVLWPNWALASYATALPDRIVNTFYIPTYYVWLNQPLI